MDGAGAESPPSSRTTTILGSFLRGRPRHSSQSHIQLNTDLHNPPQDLSPSAPQQPPSQIPQSPRRRPGVPPALMTNNNSSNNTSSGLGITSMLRRRRSAGNVSAPPAPSPQPITTSATAAAALNLGSFISRPNPPPAAATPTAATITNHGTSHLIRLVPHLDTRRSLRFDAISRDLKEGDPSLRIGRFTDRSGLGLAAVNALGSNKVAFKSKVVSRAHAEIWVESGGRFFVKDTKSSSGTFLNHVRLSVANTESRPFQIKDGDILQLGVDYQGGAEDIYKSVKIKIELGREWQASANAFNTNALKNLKTLALPLPDGNGKQAVTTLKLPTHGKSQIPDCCICLFSVTIRQALFIAPCSHTFHYKCIRPLLESHHPAFSCPLCRTFADLEEDVEVEIEYEDESNDCDNNKDVSGDCDIDIDVEASDDQGHVVSVSQPGLDDVPCSRSNSRLGLRSVEREAGAETEVEGELGVVSKLRTRRGGGGGGGSGRRNGDRAPPPLIDLTDEPDEEVVMEVSQPASSGGEMGVVVVGGGGDTDRVMDDATVGAVGKRLF